MSALKTAWEWLGHYGNLQTLWALVVGFGSAAWALSVMPGGWHPPQYWAAAGLAFFGGLFVASLVSVAGRALYRRTYATTVTLEPHGGPEATLTVHCHGQDDDVTISAQHLTMMNGAPIYPPYVMRFRDHLGHGHRDHLRIQAGGFGVVIVAAAQKDLQYAEIFLMGFSTRHYAKLEMDRQTTRYENLEPVRLRVIVRSESGLRMAEDFKLSWDGKTGFFDLERFTDVAHQ